METSTKHTLLIEKVAEAFGQAYFVFNLDTMQFQYLNNAFTQMFAITEGSNPEKSGHLLALLHPEDRDFLFDQYARLLDTKELKDLEFRVILPTDDVKWICISGRYFEETGERLIAGFAEDITKQKEYQSNILKFNAKKNSTLEILSHDLAAPFANIEGMVDLLVPELGQSDDTARELALYIKENAKKGSDLIRDFVDNEFLESAEVVLHKERVNIVHRMEIMMDNYHSMGNTLLAKKFVYEKPEQPIYMYIDVMKFMQAMNNLVSNAIKFTEDDGTITVRVEDKETTTLLTVSDNGIGIPDNLKPQLFDKFTQSRRKGLRGEKSVGLGMSIIKTIVELHKGSIWFDSQEGIGSTFYVEIPKN